MWILKILLLLLILGIIILVHEFGHFIFAKIFKVHIYEFSLGMGPVIFTHKGKDGINYNLRALPIGGFVAMAGEVYEDDNKIPKDKLLCNKPWLQRLIIMVAGVMNNFILALVILFFIGAISGVTVTKPKVYEVEKNSAAEKAGLKKGDLILSINGTKVKTWDKAQLLLIFKDKDNVYDIKVKHKNGKTENLKVSPKIKKQKHGVEEKTFGITVKSDVKKTFLKGFKYTGASILNGFKFSIQKFMVTYESMYLTIYALVTGKVSVKALSGPVGMYSIVGETLKYGIVSVVSLVAFLSINVGFINILPFPAFDGGHVLFMIIEKIKGSKVNEKIENIVHTIGFFLILALMLYITVLDIIRMF